MKHRILVSAGEPSGDILAAGVISALKRVTSEISVCGMGGVALKREGVQLIADIERVGGIMGFTELKGKSAQVLSAYRKMKATILEWKPHLLILVDFGDFNLRLAKFASKNGVKVLYFVPPKVWAWRKSRINTIKRYVDKACVIYPYERDFLQARGLKNVTYVGNPWADQISEREEIENYDDNKKAFLKRHGLNPSYKTIALFPGSRSDEIKRHLEVSLQGLKLLKEKLLKEQQTDIQVAVSIAQGFSDAEILKIEEQIAPYKDWIKPVQAESQEILLYSDSGLIKSGTSNIEAALAELPFVMFFKVSQLTSKIVKLFVKIKEYSPVNILLPHTVTELLQEKLTPERISTELQRVTNDDSVRSTMRANFKIIRDKLKTGDPVGSKSSGKTAYERCATVASIMMTTERSSIGIYRRVLSYVKPYKPTFFAALLCMIAYGATDGILPFLLKHVLDGLFQEHNLSLLYALPLAIIGFTVFRGIADFGQQYLMSKVGHGVVRDVRDQINGHISRLSSDFFLHNSSANLLSRITSDVVLVKTLLTDAASAVLRDLVRIVALLISAVYLDPTLALIALIAFPVGVFPVYKFGKKMRKLSKTGQEAIGALSSMLHESIVGQRVVKAFGREDYEISRFVKKNAELTKTFLKSEKVRAFTGPVNEVLASFAIAGVLYYGGVSVISGTRTQGDFIAFLVAMFLLYDPFKKLTRISSTIQQGMSGAERIFEILDTKPAIIEPVNPVNLSQANDILFDNVDFSYGIDSRPVLSNINLEVEQGKKIALVGLSGAGKSTLIDLVPRFIDPVSGMVKIGGVNVKQVKFEELRNRIALVSQHTFLFNDSIYNNIAYGKLTASRDEVEAAAKAAYAYDFIAKLKDGFETIVGEGGYSLSGGERQRISIARAILKDAPILILDEATASLDNKSEREVQRALDELQKNRTCIIIAHRLSTIQNVDRVLVMKDGKIIERGTHTELLKKNGEYQKLYALQFSGSLERDLSTDETAIN